MRSLSSKHQNIHAKAVQLARNYLRLEWEIIQILQQVEMTKLYKHFNTSSLFRYSVEVLGLSESVSYSLITLARKSREVPALGMALKTGRVSASKAVRICSILTPKNSNELIQFASSHPARLIDSEVARRNPSAPSRERAKAISGDQFEITFTFSRAELDRLRRAESLEARTSPKTSIAETVSAALEIYLDRRDPVRRADRKVQRTRRKKFKPESGGQSDSREKSRIAPCSAADFTSASLTNQGNGELNESELCTYRVPRREPLTAQQKHAVFARDRGCCTHRDSSGKVCGGDRWVQIHHIVPVSHGGSNDPSNLVTLCSFHHDLVHQTEMPLEGGVSWLRERFVGYST